MSATITHGFNAFAAPSAFMPYVNCSNTGMALQLAGCNDYANLYAVSSFEPALEERISSLFSSFRESRFVHAMPHAFMASATSSGERPVTSIKTPVAEPEDVVFGRPGNTQLAKPDEIPFWLSGDTQIVRPITIPASPAYLPTDDSDTHKISRRPLTALLERMRNYLGGLKDPHNLKVGPALGFGLGLGICLGFAASSFIDLDSSESSAAAPQETHVEQRKPVHRLPAISELSWDKTHVVVFNGDKQEQYYWNVMSAVKTAVEKKAAGLYVVGFGDKLEDVRQYATGSSLIDFNDIKRALADVRENSASGDTILTYISGGAERDNFVRDENKRIDHPFLAKAINHYLADRKIVLISDREMCPCFSRFMLESHGFSSLVFMGPHSRENYKKSLPEWDDSIYGNREAPLSFFWPFWYALRTDFDPNADGEATLEEAFYYGMEGYGRYSPDVRGLFRVPPSRIGSLDNVQNAVVMVTDKSSEDSNKMKPEFERAGLFAKGNIRFHLLDINKATNLPEVKSAPTTFVWKAGKIATIRKGYMDHDKITQWLADQPIAVTRMKTPMDNLYAQQDYASIALISRFDDLRERLGSDESIRVLIPLLEHEDQGVSGNAAMLLGEAAPYMSPANMAKLWKRSKNDNPVVRANVASALENISEHLKTNEDE